MENVEIKRHHGIKEKSWTKYGNDGYWHIDCLSNKIFNVNLTYK